ARRPWSTSVTSRRPGPATAVHSDAEPCLSSSLRCTPTRSLGSTSSNHQASHHPGTPGSSWRRSSPAEGNGALTVGRLTTPRRATPSGGSERDRFDGVGSYPGGVQYLSAEWLRRAGELVAASESLRSVA